MDRRTSAKAWYFTLASSQLGNELLCAVEEQFVAEGFNLKGLGKYVRDLRKTVLIILDALDSDPEGSNDVAEEQQDHHRYGPTNVLSNDAALLYGLIHARYILTEKGMAAMVRICPHFQALKYSQGLFGQCPRVCCVRQHTLPFGASALPRVSTLNVYCPRCQDIYGPSMDNIANLDGAYFGSSFAHLFVATYPLLFDKQRDEFAPTLLGFSIHTSCRNHPPKIVYDVHSGTLKRIERPSVVFSQEEKATVVRPFFANGV